MVTKIIEQKNLSETNDNIDQSIDSSIELPTVVLNSSNYIALLYKPEDINITSFRKMNNKDQNNLINYLYLETILYTKAEKISREQEKLNAELRKSSDEQKDVLDIQSKKNEKRSESYDIANKRVDAQTEYYKNLTIFESLDYEIA
jgi:hypothetical protein